MLFLVPGTLALLMKVGVLYLILPAAMGEILAILLLMCPSAIVAGIAPNLVEAPGHVPILTLLGVLVVYFCPAILLFLLARLSRRRE